MVAPLFKRKVLTSSKEFKTFWQENEPYQYAITSQDYPPVMLKQEEWIFSNDRVGLLKELMQFQQRKMKIIKAPFNPENKNVLRPDELSEWKIGNFPEEWNGLVCDIFVPEGHLTHSIFSEVDDTKKIDIKRVEQLFFLSLERDIEQLGYRLFKPRDGAKRAAIQSYLKEWEEDEADAGIQ